MSGVHFHLALTHVPVIGTLLGLLLLGYALSANKKQVLDASLLIFIVSGLAALVVYFTGEAAEEAVEHLAGISEAVIERHEEAGFIALIGALVLGAFAAFALLWQRRKALAWAPRAVLIVALVVSGIMIWTANLGGQISHPEIRPATTQQLPGADEQHRPAEHDDEDD